jgi:hypothetical protein
MSAMEGLRKLIELKVEMQKRYSAYPHDSPIAWAYGWCANELEALLPAVERELEDMKQRLANFEREGPLTPTGVELLERGVLMGLEAARKLIAENADIVEIVKDAEAKGG